MSRSWATVVSFCARIYSDTSSTAVHMLCNCLGACKLCIAFIQSFWEIHIINCDSAPPSSSSSNVEDIISACVRRLFSHHHHQFNIKRYLPLPAETHNMWSWLILLVLINILFIRDLLFKMMITCFLLSLVSLFELIVSSIPVDIYINYILFNTQM